MNVSEIVGWVRSWIELPNIVSVVVLSAGAVALGLALNRTRRYESRAVTLDGYKRLTNRQRGERRRLALLILLLGIVLPIGVLFALLRFPHFIDPSRVIFVDERGARATPSDLQLLLFIASQGVKGATADVFELFRLQLSPITTAPNALLTNLMIAAFRLIVLGSTWGALIQLLRPLRKVVPEAVSP